MPKRIQFKRQKGFKLPENCVRVTRPSRFGNPYQIIKAISANNSYFVFLSPNVYVGGRQPKMQATELALEKYEQYIKEALKDEPDFLEPLRGKDLSCFCSLQDNCHADILLKYANRSPDQENR